MEVVRASIHVQRLASQSNFFTDIHHFGPLGLFADLAAGGEFFTNDDAVGLATKLNIIVGELAKLSIIHTNDFFFRGCAEGETWDEIHDEEDDAGADEGIGETGNGVCELVAELDPVAVEPAAGDGGNAVKVCYVVTLKALVIKT